MNPHRQQEHQFTFVNPIHKSGENPTDSNTMEFSTWSEKIKVQYSYFGKPGDAKPGAWTRKVPRKNDEDGDDDDDEKEDDADNLIFLSATSSPVHISQSSMAHYRQEMMNLVRDMPETAYELSLRDIVETPKIIASQQATVEESWEEGKMEMKKNDKKKKMKMKEKEGKKNVSKSESTDVGGLLLKLLIPRISTLFGDGKRTGKSGTCSKVSPKPTLGDGENIESDMSSRSSTRSSSGRKMRKCGGCYSFFHTR